MMILAPRRSQSGFTLIELLATLALIAIALGGAMAFIVTESPERSLGKRIQQFLTFADHAQDYTMVKDETWGIVFTPPQWREEPLEQGWQVSWRKLDSQISSVGTEVNQTWAKIEGLPDIDLPPEVEMTIIIEDIEWNWRRVPEDDEQNPVVFFYSSGEKTRFELELFVDGGFGEPQHIIQDDWGNLVWKESLTEEQLEALSEF